MYGKMEVAGDNIKKQLSKWMDLEVVIKAVHTMMHIVEYIKLNHATAEKWILSQSNEELLELYVSMSKGTVPEVVQRQTKSIYLIHGEDDYKVRNFSSTWKNNVCKCLRACL